MEVDISEWDTFNHVKDIDLQNKNRSIVLVNMMQSNLNRAGEVSEAGKDLVLAYWEEVGPTPELKRMVANEARERNLL
ncbi:MAG: hypothetical protein DRQ89_13645 [Epsilonproteobacteria bacterium]|nr:MAG: hypothetical protein DRQ89_13645 [Campylobacterota bacterium]